LALLSDVREAVTELKLFEHYPTQPNELNIILPILYMLPIHELKERVKLGDTFG